MWLNMNLKTCRKLLNANLLSNTKKSSHDAPQRKLSLTFQAICRTLLRSGFKKQKTKKENTNNFQLPCTIKDFRPQI